MRASRRMISKAAMGLPLMNRSRLLQGLRVGIDQGVGPSLFRRGGIPRGILGLRSAQLQSGALPATERTGYPRA